MLNTVYRNTIFQQYALKIATGENLSLLIYTLKVLVPSASWENALSNVRRMPLKWKYLEPIRTRMKAPHGKSRSINILSKNEILTQYKEKGKGIYAKVVDKTHPDENET